MPGDGTGRFAFGFGASVIGLLAAVAGVNAFVNPYGIYRSHRFPPYAWNVRQAKLDRIERLEETPNVLVLGSSRAFGLRPAIVERRCGMTAYNASVPSGRLIDALALLNAMVARADSDRLRRVLLQLDLQSFALDVDIPLELRETPELMRFATDDPGASASGLAHGWLRLVSLSQLVDSAKSVQQWRSRSAPNLSVDADGVVHFASREAAMVSGHYNLDAAIAEEAPYEEELFRGRYPIADLQVARLRQIAAVCRERRIDLVVWLSPVHPQLVNALRRVGWDAQHEAIQRTLVSLAKTAGFRLADLSTLDRFQGDPVAFFNGTHVTTANADRVLAALLDPCD